MFLFYFYFPFVVRAPCVSCCQILGDVHQCGCWLRYFVVGFFYDLVLMFRLCVWPMSMWCVFLYSRGLTLCGECVMPARMVVWDW
jgi:hypothetical protein